jgi:hypothetical protein
MPTRSRKKQARLIVHSFSAESQNPTEWQDAPHFGFPCLQGGVGRDSRGKEETVPGGNYLSKPQCVQSKASTLIALRYKMKALAMSSKIFVK